MDKLEEEIGVNGSLENIEEWASEISNGDTDQKYAFIMITASFVLQLYEKARIYKKRRTASQRHKVLKRANAITELRDLNENAQDNWIMLLHGCGGSGKSTVIVAFLRYAKALCKEIRYPFDDKTIIVTGVTGTAGATIGGTTTSKGCCANCKDQTIV